MTWLTPAIPTTWETEIGGLRFKSSPDKKKLVRPYLKEQARHGIHFHNPSYMGGLQSDASSTEETLPEK
jgi:hypothetical protein